MRSNIFLRSSEDIHWSERERVGSNLPRGDEEGSFLQQLPIPTSPPTLSHPHLTRKVDLGTWDPTVSVRNGPSHPPRPFYSSDPFYPSRTEKTSLPLRPPSSLVGWGNPVEVNVLPHRERVPRREGQP